MVSFMQFRVCFSIAACHSRCLTIAVLPTQVHRDFRDAFVGLESRNEVYSTAARQINAGLRRSDNSRSLAAASPVQILRCAVCFVLPVV